MSQKGVRDQKNDISLTIGNLPRRLQKKFAENCHNAVTSEVNTTNGYYGPKVNQSAKLSTTCQSVSAEDAINIDLFEKKSAKIENTTNSPSAKCKGNEEIGGVNKDSIVPVFETSSAKSNEINRAELTNAVPGLLRVNQDEVTKIQEGDGNKCKNRENGKKSKQARQQHQQSRGIFHCIEDPMSPARQLPRTASPTWFNDLDKEPFAKDLVQLHDTLTNLTYRNMILDEWDYFCDTHIQLLEIFMKLQLSHLKFCCEKKVDTFFWKLLFYNVRENLKNQNTISKAQQRILFLINIGLKFYKKLLCQLEAKYLNSDTEKLLNGNRNKYETIAKVAAQKLLICLGDLSRYKIKQLQQSDYTEASEFYNRAQKLLPSNGIPYNQLAIVCIHARKKFDAVYFHMRSLMSSNPINSARESLLVLFDENRKKYEENEMKNSPVNRKFVNSNNSTCSQSTSMRKEVWIYPDGARRLHLNKFHKINKNSYNKYSDREEVRFNNMTSEELMRRFISLYMYIIGKLYTGIGMESIQYHQRKLLTQFNVLLKRDFSSWKSSRLLKIVALNIFVLEHNLRKESRREIRYHAFIFCNQLFGLILQKSNRILMEHKFDDSSSEEMTEKLTDLNKLLQFIKIYTDWLSLNVEIWEPVRNVEHTYLNCWEELEKFFAFVADLEIEENDTCDITLEEDNFLIGFTPLRIKNSVSIDAEKIVETSSYAKVFMEFSMRIRKITDFEECFKSNRELLEVDESSSFVLDDMNSAMLNALDNLKSTEIDLGDDDDNDYANDNDNSENIVINKVETAVEPIETQVSKSTDAQIIQLSIRKKELEATRNIKKMYIDKLEEILKYVDLKLYIEVRPKYLLTDTNCFIDCLEDFERLVKDYKQFTLMIPLTVVKELDGLSKGVKLESMEKSIKNNRIHHFDDVSTRAKKSLNFIRAAKNNVKCATTKGSIINSTLFALVEEEHISNDDKILATGVALSKTMSTESNKDGKCLIQTELVLLTTDRNLRVKALSRNMAVSELTEFLEWAKDCRS